MALSNADKELLGSVSKRLNDLASGLTGARAREVRKQAQILDSLADGEKATELAENPPKG